MNGIWYERTLVGLGCLLIASAACTESRTKRGEAPEGKTLSTPARVRLHPYFRDLRTVRAIVGDDTLLLLLDTGGGETLITPEVATSLGCRPHGRSVGHRMSGEPVLFSYCDSVRMSIDGASLRLAPIGVFDLNALLPPELPRLDGVLALDAFRGTVLTVDWAGDSVVAHGPSAADAAVAATGIPVRFATGSDGASLTALVEVQGRRGPLWLLLDSGNLRGTLLDEHVLRDSLLDVVDGRADLRIVGRSSWPTTITSAPLILDGALGTDFLRRGPVTVDLRAALSLRPR